MLIRQDLRAQLVQERDTIRHINLQKEIELKELQSRLDRNVRYLESLGRENMLMFNNADARLVENAGKPRWR